MSRSHRILIVRACAIGDFILNLQALRAISQQDPSSKFTLVGYPGILSLAKGFIPVEAIHSIESPPWSRLFVGPIPHLDFDTAWVWMSDPSVAENLRESGVPRVFHAAAFPKTGVSIPVHAADHLLATVGASRPELPDLWTGESTRVVIHPGSSSPEKCWPGFENLANELPDAVVLTGPCEAQFRSNRPRLEGLTLQAVAKLVGSCRAFIGNDSGITHLAAYLGCPTIALYGPTDPRVWGPIGRRVKLIWKTPISDISVNEIRNLL